LDFYSMVKERITEHYPEHLHQALFDKIAELEELQKSKYRKGVINEKMLAPIIKAEGELWSIVRDYQSSYANTLTIDGVVLEAHRFAGFISPWEYIGIEKKVFSFLQSRSELFIEKERRFPCDKCWSSPDEVRTFYFDVLDEKINRARVDWFRGAAKQRKYFKNGLYVYHCSTCHKWNISSKIYNPHG